MILSLAYLFMISKIWQGNLGLKNIEAILDHESWSDQFFFWTLIAWLWWCHLHKKWFQILFHLHKPKKYFGIQIRPKVLFCLQESCDMSSKEDCVHMLWLIPQYIALVTGEVMFYVTGMSFAYSQVCTPPPLFRVQIVNNYINI